MSDKVIHLFIAYGLLEAFFLTRMSPINTCLVLHGTDSCSAMELGMMAFLSWRLLVNNAVLSFLYYEVKQNGEKTRRLIVFVEYLLMAKLSADVVAGNLSQGGVIVDLIYFLGVSLKFTLMVMGGISLRNGTLHASTSNPYMPRDPPSQVLLTLNALTTWTFFDLALKGKTRWVHRPSTGRHYTDMLMEASCLTLAFSFF